MPEVLTCPSCQRKLQVPENLMGQDVQCPTCGATFLAQMGGSTARASSAVPSAPASSPSPSRELSRSSRRNDYEDDVYDEPDISRRRMRRRRRHDYEPHRGNLIMTLGIVGLFVAPIVLGPIAWVMANNDLEAMRTGRMDPEGESSTNTGRICGMIATILGILGLVVAVGFVCLWFSCFMAAVGGAAGSGGPKKRF